MDHTLSRLPDGRYTCALCHITWRNEPHSSCVGVPHFDYGSWPEGLYTATQLRRMHLKATDQPDGYYPLVKAPYHRYLYDSRKATPRRVPTEKQHEAIAKMQAALRETYTCQGCGRYDSSHGRSRFGVRHGYCAACRRETGSMLADAPRFPDVWPITKAILRRYRRVLVYNAAFDHRLLAVTASRYGLRVPGCQWTCLMEQYAVYHGAWSAYHRSYTWQSLAVACTCLGMEVQGEAHRATADALAALGVLRALAALDGQIAPYPVPMRESIQGDDHPFSFHVSSVLISRRLLL